MGHDITVVIVALMVVVSHFSLRKKRSVNHVYYPARDEKNLARLKGVADKALFKARISEKLAERAFTLASSANVGVSIVSSALGTRPKPLTKEQLLQNEVATEKLKDLFGQDEAEYLKPLLDDEEVELLESAQKQYEKAKAKGKIV